MELCCQTPNQCPHCRITDREDALLRSDIVSDDEFGDDSDGGVPVVDSAF